VFSHPVKLRSINQDGCTAVNRVILADNKSLVCLFCSSLARLRCCYDNEAC